MSLTGRERERIVDQIHAVVEQLFVHRRMKSTLYGVDTVVLLRGLRGRVAHLTDADFHREMRGIVNRLRDRHTRYSYDGAGPTYTLPFTVERAFVDGQPSYLVTGSRSPNIPVGSQLTLWNGVPIQFLVGELANEVGAGNVWARHALARIFLTQRPAARFDPPREAWVDLSLVLADATTKEVRIAWDPLPPVSAAASALRGSPTGQGVDADLLQRRQHLFSAFSPQFKALSATPYPNVETRVVQHEGRGFAYLRIHDFSVDDADDFAAHIAQRLRLLPPNGLIIDLRGNPGGYIRAGELLLQMLTNRKIQPHRFRFRASDAVDYLIGHSDNYRSWEMTVAQGVRLGGEHSEGFPIEGDEASFNRIGRCYAGPSVLLVDALTFSTADMMSAGFTDHAIGAVVCTDENIAAGGANNWPSDVLRASFPGFLLPAEVEHSLDAGVLEDGVRAAFAAADQPLSGDASVRQGPSDRLGRLWQVEDGRMIYTIGKRDWLRQELAVYYDGDNPYVGSLPAGVELGFSVRQAVRRQRSEGLVLEDEGIRVDHHYQMTRQDVLAKNVDLIAFACGLLGSATSPPA